MPTKEKIKTVDPEEGSVLVYVALLFSVLSLLIAGYGALYPQSTVPVLEGSSAPKDSKYTSQVDTLKNSYMQAAGSTTMAEGTIVEKNGASLLVEMTLIDEAKVGAAKDAAGLAYETVRGKVRMEVLVTGTTYFPFKSLEDLKVGEKIVVVSATPIKKGASVSATHIYNDIPGL